MENSYLGRSWYFVTFSVADYPPPPPSLENPNFPPQIRSCRLPPPSLGNSYLGRLWYFVIFQLQITPPPPPLWKIQISNFFPKSKFEVADYPPPLPPPLENSYLGRSWYFVIFQLQITPPPPLSGKSKFPTFSLSPNSKLQITPPPPPHSYLGRSWYFVIFQLQITLPPPFIFR